MLDLCIFGIAKKFIKRANKFDKVNLQTAHIVSILESLMSAAVPRNVTSAFRNAGVSLIMDADRTIRCAIMPETARCILGSPFEHGLMQLAQEEETGREEGEPNIEEYFAKTWEQFG
jgi:hypothetical protein